MSCARVAGSGKTPIVVAARGRGFLTNGVPAEQLLNEEWVEASGRRRRWLSGARRPPPSLQTRMRDRQMKIVVAGQPKTGNVWLKHILASLYDLEILEDIPEPTDESLRAWLERGRFSDNSVFHEHFWPTDALFAALEAERCLLVTPVRSPYDAFVSLYHFVQRHSHPFTDRLDPAADLVGLPIDHPRVLNFLRHQFAGHLQLSRAWMQSGRSVVTRYEFLHSDPAAEVTRIAQQLAPVAPARVRRAVKATRAGALKRRGGYWGVHIRTATVGDWRRHLTREHLEIFRVEYGDIIRGLGYRVL